MRLSELSQYIDLDFSLEQNKELFKKLYNDLVIEPSSYNPRSHVNLDIAVFHYLLRKLQVSSKDYQDLKSIILNTYTAMPAYNNFYNYDINMYQLDMFSDWDENNPNSMLQTAINM